MKKIFIIAIISLLSACNSKENVKGEELNTSNQEAPLITQYVVGYPAMDYIEAEKRIAKQWGINMEYEFAGCVVSYNTDKKGNTIEANNKKAYLYYEKKFGKDWQTKFQKEVEKEINTIMENNTP